MLFWVTGLSFKIFGINAFAYKFPSLLFSILAIYSTTRLGELLFNKRTGILAGLMLGFSQAFIISIYDVKTDSILTGATAFAIYQYIKFSIDRKYVHIVLGSLGLAVAVGSKGMIAVVVTGCTIFLHLVYHRRWKEMFHWQWLSIIPWFFIFLSPFLYAYYQQFDAHPEKITNGVKGISGIKFLLWTQSFERLAGQRQMVNNPDYLFFFHSFLWAFLPWSIVAYYKTFRDWVLVLRQRFNVIPGVEFGLSGTVLLVMILMSTSQFKLPHYLNILFPLFAVLTAKVVMRLIEKTYRLPKWMRITFYILSGAYIALGALLTIWAFPMDNILLMALAVIALVVIGVIVFRVPYSAYKPVFVVMIVAGIVNFFLLVHVFPRILQYQGSLAMSRYINKNDIPKDKLNTYVANRYFGLDVYTKTEMAEPELPELRGKLGRNESFYLITDNIRIDELKVAEIPIDTVTFVPHFHVSMLTGKFINPATRAASMDTLFLLKVN
jgi:4-amino-4-deoxy-L-arabinose transferase-like glycosyltransferase